MRITEFEVRNFKSFGDYENPSVGLVEDLRKMNMVYGENNSGKSNLLKFINLIFSSKIGDAPVVRVEGDPEPVRRKVSTPFWKGSINNSPFLFHKNERTREIKFSFKLELNTTGFLANHLEVAPAILTEYPSPTTTSTLSFKGLLKSYSDPYSCEIILKQVVFNGREMFADDGVGRYYFRSGGAVQALLGEGLTFENLMSSLNDCVLLIDTDRFVAEEKENRKLKKLTAKNYKNWLHNLSLDPIHHNLYVKYINFVKKHHDIFDLFKNFSPSFSAEGENVQLMISNGHERLPIDSYGTGLQQLLYLLAILFEAKSRIILIEELELNLSPKSQKKAFKMIRSLIEEGIIDQVIFTTHSPYFKFTTDFSFYEVNMNGHGVSTIEKKAAVRKSFFINNPLA